VFQTYDVLGVSAYCDEISDAGSLPAVRAGAESWNQQVVSRVDGAPPPDPDDVVVNDYDPGHHTERWLIAPPSGLRPRDERSRRNRSFLALGRSSLSCC